MKIPTPGFPLVSGKKGKKNLKNSKSTPARVTIKDKPATKKQNPKTPKNGKRQASTSSKEKMPVQQQKSAPVKKTTKNENKKEIVKQPLAERKTIATGLGNRYGASTGGLQGNVKRENNKMLTRSTTTLRGDTLSRAKERGSFKLQAISDEIIGQKARLSFSFASIARSKSRSKFLRTNLKAVTTILSNLG